MVYNNNKKNPGLRMKPALPSPSKWVLWFHLQLIFPYKRANHYASCHLDRLPVHHRVHAERPQLTKRFINCLKKVLSQQLKKVLSSLYGWALSCTKRIPGLPAPTVGSDSWSKDFILIHNDRKGAVPQPEELNANWTPQYLAVSSGTSKGHHLVLSAITAQKKNHLEKKSPKWWWGTNVFTGLHL